MIAVDITDYMKLEIKKHRWHIEIIVTTPDASPQTYIASADGYDTDGDGIYFGTKEDWEERRASAY